MTTSTSPEPAAAPPPLDPIKKVAIQLCVDITGAFQVGLGGLIAKMQQDKGFRNTVLFSLGGKDELGIVCQPTPEIAQHIYNELRRLLVLVLELERMEIAGVLTGAPAEATFADLATAVAEREGLPDMPSDPPPEADGPKVAVAR